MKRVWALVVPSFGRFEPLQEGVASQKSKTRCSAVRSTVLLGASVSRGSACTTTMDLETSIELDEHLRVK
jgi:hypothetical protein